MKRGFPRPQMKVVKCSTNTVTDEDGRKHYGRDYGAKWNDKTYPIPYSAQESNISTVSGGRMKECVHFKKCIACGDPVTEDNVWALYKAGKIFSESGPFHEKCSKLTARMCPHIVVNDSAYEFKVVEWATVKDEVQGYWLTD